MLYILLKTCIFLCLFNCYTNITILLLAESMNLKSSIRLKQNYSIFLFVLFFVARKNIFLWSRYFNILYMLGVDTISVNPTLFIRLIKINILNLAHHCFLSYFTPCPINVQTIYFCYKCRF